MASAGLKDTIELYNKVIDDVINSVEAKWRKTGGNNSTLEQIRDLWRYRALKTCGLNLPEPELSTQVRIRKDKKQGEADFSNFMAMLNLQPDGAKEESESSMESADDMSSESVSSEETDDFGSDLDDDVMHMVCHERPVDLLTCNYEKWKKTNGKAGVTQSFNFSGCHFEIGGVPRVIKNGNFSVKIKN